MMRLILLLFTLPVATWLMSCDAENSEDVNQNRIYTEYWLSYNANSDVTSATAKFRFGGLLGTPLELTDPSTVRCNNEALKFNEITNSYSKDFAGYVKEGTFEWTDVNGKIFENSVTINEIDYPADLGKNTNKLDTISRDAAYEIFWQGSPLTDKEFVGLFVNGENENDATANIVANSTGDKSFIIDKITLQKLGSGPGFLIIQRTNNPGLSEATSAGGFIWGTYRPPNLSVYFK